LRIRWTSAAAPVHPDGPAVNYNYGILSVKVTVSGHKILKVGIASIDDGGNPRSQYIDQQSIPMLKQQVIQAQSAHIQGVPARATPALVSFSRSSRRCTA
jgi:uncharacterized protein with FMN-binding domain